MRWIRPGAVSPPVWRRPMVGRRTDEEDRGATRLELLFDLCFVVAVALSIVAAGGAHFTGLPLWRGLPAKLAAAGGAGRAGGRDRS